MARGKTGAFAVVCLGAHLVAQSPTLAARSQAYVDAAKAYLTDVDAAQRVKTQVMLIAAGYWTAMPTASFGERLFEAIKKFQSENGFLPDGILDNTQTTRLASISSEELDSWGFQKVRHPFRNHTIWIPFGLGLTTERNRFGLQFSDPAKRVLIDYTTVPDVSIEDDYTALLNEMARNNVVTHFKVLKDGWFVISATTPEGIDQYLRYHQDGANVTGFSLNWNNANGDVHGERIAVLMSASLWSDMSGAWTIDPPVLGPAPRQPPQAKEEAAAKPVPAPDPAAKPEDRFQTGTGFFVAEDGTLLTNAHVVDHCADPKVKADDGSILEAKIIATDTSNDLALIKVDKKPSRVAAFRSGTRLGETVEAFGFPHSDILSTSGNFTTGNMTALNGMDDDSRFFQISAPVQAGNSGGPLLDQSGNVVGIVTSKLNALKVALADGDLPQNVNFAVKTGIIAAFLESNRVVMQTGVALPKPLDPPDIADQARAISGFVICKTVP